WLDPEDKQRRQYFENAMRSQQQKAQKLAKKLPKTGEVNAVARQYSDGAIALSLLHSTGQLTWQDPFHYTINNNAKMQTNNQLDAAQQMVDYLNTRECRWKYLLRAFGFGMEAEKMRCGCCDRCK
ncbi:MAG TPA: recombinase RecQ, partial [Cyanobacteria bacterium UBA11368]|nr:recombinase RecQ [Cyanobacteria bacterium UBA11368]